jgi:branched-chain amino acid transport system ATP-binding protein
MLEVRSIDVAYGAAQVLRGVTLDVRAGEILCLLGRNGAGKTTTLKAIMRLLPLQAGAIVLHGESIGDLPAHRVPARGIGYVPQGRRLFAELSVRENLEIGLMVRNHGEETLEKVLDLFPRLRERLAQRADTLSGGEQQMLAMGRALCIEPEILLLDEPTEGLQPSMIAQIRNVIQQLKDRGAAIVLVEQRVDAVLSLADRVTFLENGRTGETVAAAELRDRPDLVRRYVGVT